MADVTIRYAPTGETREIDETAVPFFPGWTVVRDKAGAKATSKAESTTTPSKES
jgi:hypothetical protein